MRRAGACGAGVMLAGLAGLAGPAMGRPANWQVISDGVDDSRLSADLASLRCEGVVCSVRERTSYLRPLANGASIVMDQVQYDCGQALTRTLAEVASDAQGRVLARLSGASPWSPVRLGTLGFQSLTFACRHRGDGPPQTPPPPTQPQAPAVAPRAPAPPRATPLRASTSTAGAPSGFRVQVISSSSEAGARAALRAMAREHLEAAKLTASVQSVQVQGRLTYRGLWSGFASRAAAAAFCRRLGAAGDGCLVRDPPGGPDQ